MSVLTKPVPLRAPSQPLLGTSSRSPAGPVETLSGLRQPPAVRLPKLAQTLWFSQRQASFVFHQRERFGDVFVSRAYLRGPVMSACHPDHVRSLYLAPPALVPSIGEESPVRPPLGPASLLTRTARGTSVIASCSCPRFTARPSPATSR